MKILALDTATHTGWAVSANEVITSGYEDFSVRTSPTLYFPADHPGKRFSMFSNWMEEKLREDKIDLIVYESIVGGRSAGGTTSLIQKGLEAMVLKLAYDTDLPIPVWSFAPATIKKWATGNGQLTHESKQQMVDMAYKAFPNQIFLPHRPTRSKPWIWDDNQCDALWLLDLAHRVYQYSEVTIWPPSVPLDASSPEIVDNLTKIANLVTAEKWPTSSKPPRR